jgi:phospholipid/cholesterol/gamma-HCH transport system substrate-binding protein
VPTSSVAGRIAATLALFGAVVVVVLLVLGGGSTYTVTAAFENASQLVKGNNVSVAGVPVGSISDIKLSDDGQAEVEMEISDEAYTPLPEGTQATIRSQSLSGIANRYVSLDLPPEADGEGAAPPIESGGAISQANTTSEVDLDQLFNTLNRPTVEHLKQVIRGFARTYDGIGPQANRGFHYLNPFLSTSRRVFGELNSDTAALESLLVDTSSLTGALSERSDDLSQLVSNLNGMLGATGRHEAELASAVGQLPDFMRQFNTTAVNLRAALDDVDPLVAASRPVARKLQPFAKRLRSFSSDAVPTVKRLDRIVRRPGAANDLTELVELQPPLSEIAVGPVSREGVSREGALPAATSALRDSMPQLSFLRPYVTAEGVTGWFDDFGHSGMSDAAGAVGRVPTTINPFTLGLPATPIPGLPAGTLLPNLNQPIDLSQLDGNLGGLEALGISLDNTARCPGSNERDVPPGQLTYGGAIDCDTTQVPIGP